MYVPVSDISVLNTLNTKLLPPSSSNTVARVLVNASWRDVHIPLLRVHACVRVRVGSTQAYNRLLMNLYVTHTHSHKHRYIHDASLCPILACMRGGGGLHALVRRPMAALALNTPHRREWHACMRAGATAKAAAAVHRPRRLIRWALAGCFEERGGHDLW